MLFSSMIDLRMVAQLNFNYIFSFLAENVHNRRYIQLFKVFFFSGLRCRALFRPLRRGISSGLLEGREKETEDYG